MLDHACRAKVTLQSRPGHILSHIPIHVWVLETCVLIIIIQPIRSIWVWKDLPKSRFICCLGPHPHKLQTIPATMSFDEGTWEIQHLKHVLKMVHVELRVTKYTAWMGIGITNELHCVVPFPTPNHLFTPLWKHMKQRVLHTMGQSLVDWST